jgi:hypothetical protein
MTCLLLEVHNITPAAGTSSAFPGASCALNFWCNYTPAVSSRSSGNFSGWLACNKTRLTALM